MLREALMINFNIYSFYCVFYFLVLWRPLLAVCYYGNNNVYYNYYIWNIGQLKVWTQICLVTPLLLINLKKKTYVKKRTKIMTNVHKTHTYWKRTNLRMTFLFFAVDVNLVVPKRRIEMTRRWLKNLYFIPKNCLLILCHCVFCQTWLPFSLFSSFKKLYLKASVWLVNHKVFAWNFNSVQQKKKDLKKDPLLPLYPFVMFILSTNCNSCITIWFSFWMQTASSRWHCFFVKATIRNS